MPPVGGDFKIIKEKSIDKLMTLKISQNIATGRIFVEFVTDGKPRIVLQKSFQDNYMGKLEADKFAKSITSIDQLRKHFGIRK